MKMYMISTRVASYSFIQNTKCLLFQAGENFKQQLN